MAVALLTVFYAIIVAEIFFAILFKAYSSNDKADVIKPMPLREIGLAVVVLSVGLTTFFLLILSFSTLTQL